MPELPEVETVRKTLENLLVNRTIEDVHLIYPRIIDGDPEDFKQTVSHQTIRRIDRYGKYLIFILDSCAFLSHLRMEGKYFLKDKDEEISKHEHILFDLDYHQQLRYHDVRKFGRMKLVDQDHYLETLPLSKLGPEPFNADPQVVYQQFKNKNTAIKTALLDQSIMAGIGNIYANEICYEMKIDPRTPVKNLSKKRVQELIQASIVILSKAIEQGGTTIHSFSVNGIDGLFQAQLKVHMATTCPLGHDVKKIMLNGRGTYYCPICQKKRR